MNIPPNRVDSLDILKGIAIISVVLYHAGIMSYGYLGVDIFLVISSYLTTKSISKNYSTGDFNYFRYIRNRLPRLYPSSLNSNWGSPWNQIFCHVASCPEKRVRNRNRHIDLMAYLANSDGSIPAFTHNHKFISHDGLHLTRASAQFVASRIDVSELLEAE